MFKWWGRGYVLKVIEENKLEIIAIEHGHAEGIISVIKSALSKVDLVHWWWDVSLRIIGFCADGANVNTGQRNGVVILLSPMHSFNVY